MNSEDYYQVITLINDIINRDARLKSIEEKNYLEENYIDYVVKEYINFRTTKAEALLGMTGVKLSKVLLTIIDLKNSTNIKTTGDLSTIDLKIKDIIPKETDLDKLGKAAVSFYLFIKDLKKNLVQII